MKDNILILKDKNDKKKEYKILFNIQSIKENKNYIIYTPNTKTKEENLAFVATYEISNKGNMVKFNEVEEIPEFIEKIIDSLKMEEEE